MKTLIVEDDPDILDVVSLSIEMRWPDATVVAAQTGASGLEAVGSARPDLVLLDLGLPDMDGLEVCRRIRESSDVPIIIVSVRDKPTDIVKGLENGADGYITKPFNVMDLLARIGVALRRARAAGSAKP